MTTKNTPRLLLTTTALGLAVQLVGCGTTTPELDAKFGDAVRASRQQQILNPSAPTGNNPVLGISGQAAVTTQERYNDSFKTPPRTFEVLGIGGALSSGQ